MTPNFSARPYPWSALRRLTRDDAAVETMLARWLAASPRSWSWSSSSSWERLRRLLRLDASATITVTSHGTRPVSPVVATVKPDDPHAGTRAAPSPFAPTSPATLDPHAAICAVDVHGVAIEVAGSSLGTRALAQRLLGGPAELAAPRPLGAIEQSLWSLVVATALEDLGIRAHVRPAIASTALADLGVGSHARPTVVGRGAATSAPTARLLFDVVIGDIAIALEVRVPPVLATKAPRTSTDASASASASASARLPTVAPRADQRTENPRVPGSPTWVDRVHFDIPIVAGRCAIHRDDLARLAVRSLVTLERPGGGAGLELDIFGVAVPLSGDRVTGYVPRDMSLPDTAHVELTVSLGTTKLSLRQITELAVGQIVQLGRPLGGPFELRADGRVLGRGELVDVDGELAVRIVSLGD